jgi:hypothetical protein
MVNQTIAQTKLTLTEGLVKAWPKNYGPRIMARELWLDNHGPRIMAR